jgi:ribosomal-protein-alanine N-acetyltransferase
MSTADLPAELRLERQSYPAPWHAWFFRRLLRRRASCWVLEQGGIVCGYGVMRCVRGWAHIMNLCVAQDRRRRGLGRKMLIQLMKKGHHCGAGRAWLEVHPDNRGAIALYRSLGFRTQLRRKGYYLHSPQRQRDALIMTCKLGYTG